ncbi:MAG: Tetratricopeptide repeat protein [Glaciihabitans sp.]|nr:Tetratricopeptide repeat protein [Glaciihabitans sp.]
MLSSERDVVPPFHSSSGQGSSSATASRLQLPPVPDELSADPVAAWSEDLVIDTYLPLDPSEYPAFLDTRVYQGSSGKVFPLPFHERISQEKHPHTWRAVHLENEFIRLVILPDLGGRIHVGYDKTADYDFFYRNNVIKPALVGLAGPWLSGGVEFNWPQHHRPATFLPVDYSIEREPDGAVTVWCSDHDPFSRMKGMHGIRLRPGSSLIEARVRLYNRTPDTQTFLWWANVAAAVSDDYQSFFPTDVHFVADHAKRALATFPAVDGRYYGVDYSAQVSAEVPDGDRLDWYRNIPVPTSYMVVSTRQNFFGGYDHGRHAGFVHWADRHVAPGKKQWTWGNAEFGWAWDRNLTDTDGPYVELMAGVYTDNQPDFSWLSPGETKAFSQFWFPIREIGPATFANREAALSLTVTANEHSTTARLGVSATRPFEQATVELFGQEGRSLFAGTARLGPADPFVLELEFDGVYTAEDLELVVSDGARTIARWRPEPAHDDDAPTTANEPPLPAEVDSIEDLFYIGQYLAQYRHATRAPEPYWREALDRDPEDVRSNIALAASLDRRGRYREAELHLRRAIGRLTARVPNPADGEAHYRLGLNLVRQGRDAEALELFAKAEWNSAWRVPAGYEAARAIARAGRLDDAEQKLRSVLRLDADHLQAADLLALVLQSQGSLTEASEILERRLQLDPLDEWALDLAGRPTTRDAPTLLDVALDYASAGFTSAALTVLDRAAVAASDTALGQVQVAPLVHYHRAMLLSGSGDPAGASEALGLARTADGRFAQALRLDDVRALQFGLRSDPGDARAAYLLGNWHYDHANYAEAIAAWTAAAAHSHSSTELAAIHRNLGIAAFNVSRDPELAAHHFDSAQAADLTDAALLYESDQLASRVGVGIEDRLSRIQASAADPLTRDDLTVVYAGLLTATGEADRARDIILTRQFQPWEGGEGKVLGAWEDAAIAIASRKLANDPAAAVTHLLEALFPPESLGEARHPLANAAQLYCLLGDAYAANGDIDAARGSWQTASAFSGDFLGMSTRSFSTQTLWSARALRNLGEEDAADRLINELRVWIQELAETPARIDYFATSLPTMLLFHEDPQAALDRDLAELRAELASLTR